jgi:PPK2 family polyphosphate:nucleotide phosphotransferase
MPEQVIRPKAFAKVKLAKFDPDYAGNLEKEATKAETEKLKARLDDLQEILYAQNKYSLLIVLQAMDGGGKDSTIDHIFSGINPQGFRIANFKAPTPEELSHDFLWRIHAHVPPKGYIGIFNRSHYEDVLVVRVDELVSKDIWQARYEHINHFERLLADSDVVIRKFYLHISKEEQKARFQARLDDPKKHWKFSTGDLPVRAQWDEYMKAYEDAISNCNTEYAPWHIIPANRKWVRNYFVTKTLVEALESLPLQFPAAEEGLETVVIPD